MTLTLTQKRKDKLILHTSFMLKNPKQYIRKVAALVGMIIAALPAVRHGRLFYRCLEKDKNLALSYNKGNYNKTKSLSSQALQDVLWWCDNIQPSSSFIHPPPIEKVIYTDASLEGWGATDSHDTVGGEWEEDNPPAHINILELEAAYLALLSLAKHTFGAHICLKMDNTTAVSYVNKMGGAQSVTCDKLARTIWSWAMEHDVWLSAVFIPGKHNVVADFHSRCPKDNTEWKLHTKIFENICEVFHLPTIDLFASDANKQTSQYVSWKLDPSAWAVDAFTIPWANLNFYAFPPFSIISRVLTKLDHDKATGILILPTWTTQAWFPLMLRLLIDHPFRVPPHKHLLSLPRAPQQVHPLYKKLDLLVLHLSGEQSRTSEYQSKLKSSSKIHGEHQLEFNMIQSYEGGDHFVLQDKLIPLHPL